MELDYHQMKPEEFDELISQARPHTPGAVRLPPKLVEAVKMVAESEGEPRYQVLVRRWIEERLRQEARLAVRLSRGLKRQITKKTTASIRKRDS